jgi:NAD(P)-dependent dehydrogenase (short-subunit alcohol dehydrogenase family)
MECEDIVFIVTGGGTGIGRALAFSLAKLGEQVLILGRREPLLQEVSATASNIHYLCADVSTPEGLDLIKKRVQGIPHIKGLINNAGTLDPLMSLKEMNIKEWHQAFNTNLDPALFLPQLLYTQLTNGRVLNISSGAAYFAIRGWAAYCVSKAALSMLTKCWQLESDSIAFASVMPGIIDTQMQAIARSAQNPDEDRSIFYNRLKEHQRLLTAETVAEFLTWLLLDVDKHTYSSHEWDIYDTTHHKEWLKPPHQVLHWDF